MAGAKKSSSGKAVVSDKRVKIIKTPSSGPQKK